MSWRGGGETLGLARSLTRSVASSPGFLFGQLSTKIILAQLTKGPFPYTPILLLPLAIGAIGVNTPWLGLYATYPAPPHPLTPPKTPR